MADTLASGEKMLAAARAANRTLGVNYNYRTVPSLRLIRETITAGDFGAPALFAAHMHAYLFPHWLDLLLYLFGSPAEVAATFIDDQSLRPPVSSGPTGRPWKFGEGIEMLYHPSIAVTATFRFRNPDFLGDHVCVAHSSRSKTISGRSRSTAHAGLSPSTARLAPTSTAPRR